MSRKTQTILQKWLAEYISLRKDQLSNYTHTTLKDDALFSQLQNLLQNGSNVIELSPVCHQLYDFYRSDCSKLNEFVMEILPAIICAYANAFSNHSHRTNGLSDVLESCLLGIYNMIISRTSIFNETNFMIPSFSNSSVFHKGFACPELVGMPQHTGALQPIFTTVSEITSANRQIFLWALINYYSLHLSNRSLQSKQGFCLMSSRLCSLTAQPRIHITSDLLVELVWGVYQILFMDNMQAARDSLLEMQRRAIFETMVRPIQILDSIIHSLESDMCNIWHDNHLSEVGVFKSSSRVSRSRTMSSTAPITNATFKPEKLPDDIPIIEEGRNDVLSNVKNNQVLKPSEIEVELYPMAPNHNGLTHSSDYSSREPPPTDSVSFINGRNAFSVSVEVSKSVDSDCDKCPNIPAHDTWTKC